MFFRLLYFFLLSQQLLVLLLRYSFFCTFHLLSAMIFMIVYLLPSFLSYWFDFECLLFAMCSLWAFLCFCTFAFVGFLLVTKDAIFMLSCFFLITSDSHAICLCLLVWLVCTLQLLPCGQWRSFNIRHSEYMFQILLKSIEFVSYSYHIFFANISIGKWGLVITCGFVYFLFLHTLCSGDSIIERYSLQKRGMIHSSERYLSTFYIILFFSNCYYLPWNAFSYCFYMGGNKVSIFIIWSISFKYLLKSI